MVASTPSRSACFLHRVTVRRLAWLAFAATLVTAGLITYGAWVRVSASGLGCPNWPLCTDASQNGKAAFIESGHRVMATLDVILVYVSALLAWFKRRGAPRPFLLLVIAAVLIVAQAVLGGITVRLDLPGFIRLAHLVLAMTVLAALAAASTLLLFPDEPPVKRTLEPRLLLLLGAATILLGGSIVATQTSFGCLQLPFCDTSTTPMAASLHALHRLLGLVLGLVAAGVVLTLRATGGKGALKRVGYLLLALVAAQLLLGAVAIESTLPGALRILHLGLAALIWWALITFLVLTLPNRASR